MKKGFTLIELIIVIAIIGILATVGTLNLTTFRNRAHAAVFKAEVAQTRTKLVSDCYALDTPIVVATPNATYGALTEVCGVTGAGTFSVVATSVKIPACTITITDTAFTDTDPDCNF